MTWGFFRFVDYNLVERYPFQFCKVSVSSVTENFISSSVVFRKSIQLDEQIPKSDLYPRFREQQPGIQNSVLLDPLLFQRVDVVILDRTRIEDAS
jgi:hypothetical protein